MKDLSSNKLWRGTPSPLGATIFPNGVNFAIFSEHAEKVELCLFDEKGQETNRIEMTEQTHKVWHGLAPGVKAGQHYGYRVHGPYDPSDGRRFNPHKLLLDPYAKAISGPIQWDPAVFAYQMEESDLAPNATDSGPYMPKSIVVSDQFDWEDDTPPKTPWHDTTIYEVHVKGFTKLHPELADDIKGTYSALAHPVVVDYLKNLGITAVELMPIHQFVSDENLNRKGLSNYWGYNTIGYFAPEWRYSSSGTHGHQVSEFKRMIKSLHKAGLEVIIDVVYNHTAEGNHLGPTLSFRGIDNLGYYRLMPDDLRYYMDYTGCGNTLNVINHHTLRLIMDSLRYWVREMHVDGFRFDLAPALARGLHEVNELHTFFAIIRQDPVLSEVKLIAEPWDIGEGGYQVGGFPDHWAEWNDKYRDTVRAFWKGEGGVIDDLGYRLMGSSDLYEAQGRRPFASINFVTSHDGFTLQDLVSYDHKHNEANKENNSDGHDHNLSANYGHEGPTADPQIVKIRQQMKKNFLLTLLLSQGVPMLLGGDEIGRTQQGNNNAYCQDNEISWFSWDSPDQEILAFTQWVLHLRRSHRVFHRRQYFEGKSTSPGENKDLIWFLPNGNEMTTQEWNHDFAQSLGLFLNGKNINERNWYNELIEDENFVWILNASDQEIEFSFPSFARDQEWIRLCDTSVAWPQEQTPIQLKDRYKVASRSSVLLKQRT